MHKLSLKRQYALFMKHSQAVGRYLLVPSHFQRQPNTQMLSYVLNPGFFHPIFLPY